MPRAVFVNETDGNAGTVSWVKTPIGAFVVVSSGSGVISGARWSDAAPPFPPGSPAVELWTSIVESDNSIWPVAPSGSPFRLKIWKALTCMPEGETITYGGLAAAVGMPGAARAVASAVACNPIAVLIPCHRVVPSAGGVGNYRWGRYRKSFMLGIESRSGGQNKDKGVPFDF